MVDIILFPSSYFTPKRVDEDLQEERDAVLDTGLFEIILFDYRKWCEEKELRVSEIPPVRLKAVYRGWMMPPEEYKQFYEALLGHNIQIITTPADYIKMHIFPNVYQKFGTDTAKIRLFPLHEQIDVNGLKDSFYKFMVKDFVKSVKGTEFPKYFTTNNLTQEEFDNWMETFYHYRGHLLTGGICIKEFLNLKYYGDKTNEYRVFYANGEVLTVSPNSAQPNFAPHVPQELVEKYKNLGSIYYTVDYAELEDGSWKVIEAGDGSVSGLSENQDIEAYFRALYNVFNL